MVNSETHRPESLYSEITSWASHARPWGLVLLALLALAGSVGVVLVDWHRWPLAALLLSASTVGAWGLLDQKTVQPHSRAIRALEWLLVGLGIFAALMGGLGVFFWLLGPAPIL